MEKQFERLIVALERIATALDGGEQNLGIASSLEAAANDLHNGLERVADEIRGGDAE